MEGRIKKVKDSASKEYVYPVTIMNAVGVGKGDSTLLPEYLDNTYIRKEDAYVLPVAESGKLGGIKVGNNLRIDSTGTLHGQPGVDATDVPENKTIISDGKGGWRWSAPSTEIDIPAATHSTLGGIKVGEHLSINQEGVLNAEPGFTAAAAGPGQVPTADGEGNWDWKNALTEIPIATESRLGGIKVGANLTIDEDGKLSAEKGIDAIGTLKGQVPTADGEGNWTWEMQEEVITSIDKLKDVQISDLKQGQVLSWENTVQKWINSDIKGGGGSGGVYATTTIIFEGHIDSENTFNLNDSIDNYDYLMVCGWNYNSEDSHDQFNSLLIYKNDYYRQTTSEPANWAHVLSGYDSRRIVFYFLTDKKIQIMSRTDASIDVIYGIKFLSNEGGGGIDQTPLLLLNSTLGSGTHTLNQPIEDKYDFLLVCAYMYYNGNTKLSSVYSLIPKDNFYNQGAATGADVNYAHLIMGNNRKLGFKFNDENTISITADANTCIYQVYGIKSGGGGGISKIPVASEEVLGGIKVGDGLSITEDGILSTSKSTKVQQENYIYSGQQANQLFEFDFPIENLKSMKVEWTIDNDATVWRSWCDMDILTWYNANNNLHRTGSMTSAYADRGIYLTENNTLGLYTVATAYGSPQLFVTCYYKS